jgi:hypothetical protein
VKWAWEYSFLVIQVAWTSWSRIVDISPQPRFRDTFIQDLSILDGHTGTPKRYWWRRKEMAFRPWGIKRNLLWSRSETTQITIVLHLCPGINFSNLILELTVNSLVADKISISEENLGGTRRGEVKLDSSADMTTNLLPSYEAKRDGEFSK